MTDAGVELLGTLPSLMSLDLSGCNIQDQGVAALGNNPRFRDITLAECPNITDLGLQVRTENLRESVSQSVSQQVSKVGRSVSDSVSHKSVSQSVLRPFACLNASNNRI